MRYHVETHYFTTRNDGRRRTRCGHAIPVKYVYRFFSEFVMHDPVDERCDHCLKWRTDHG